MPKAKTNLVIVESPAKARTIEKYLGSDYKVDASGGHISDLPEKALGVDVENNFEPEYITVRGKANILKELEKKAAKVIEGEALDIVIGSRPYVDEDKKKKDKEDKAEKEAVKKSILKILKDYYDMEEEDFLSAELEVVPAGKAYEAGFDRSMIMAYGQDDRVCAFPSYRAMFAVEELEKTACCILVDKEEIGSVGATGMQSMFFENTMAEVMNLCGDYNELKLRRCLANSNMLSSDVSAAFDPNYPGVNERKNTAYFGKESPVLTMPMRSI